MKKGPQIYLVKPGKEREKKNLNKEEIKCIN